MADPPPGDDGAGADPPGEPSGARTTECDRTSRSRYPYVVAGACYLALAVLLWAHVWTGHPSTVTTCGCGDTSPTIWFTFWPAKAPVKVRRYKPAELGVVLATPEISDVTVTLPEPMLLRDCRAVWMAEAEGIFQRHRSGGKVGVRRRSDRLGRNTKILFDGFFCAIPSGFVEHT